MNCATRKTITIIISKVINIFIVITFTITSIITYPQKAYSSDMLPAPGTMVHLSESFTPLLLKGVSIDPNNPLHFEFIVDAGNEEFESKIVKEESERLMKYFLASLTIPEDDLWVNLSPFEKDRITTDALAQTELGRDLLSQDYLLKQLSATLIDPEKDLGKKFWKRIYKEAYEKYGVTDILVDTFNKVWILPESATVFENENAAYVVEGRLKVMLDQDYVAMQHNLDRSSSLVTSDSNRDTSHKSRGTDIFQSIILPAIEKEVNEGKNFAPLRQIYHSLILGKWYKSVLKESILVQKYFNNNKIGGIDIQDKQIKEKIYSQYVAAFKKGVFNYIKEDIDAVSQRPIPRKYFSGGIDRLMNVHLNRTNDVSMISDASGRRLKLDVELNPEQSGNDRGMLTKETLISEIGMPDRFISALQLRDVKNLEDLVLKSSDEILAIKNIGPKALEDIERALYVNGLALGMSEEALDDVFPLVVSTYSPDSKAFKSSHDQWVDLKDVLATTRVHQRIIIPAPKTVDEAEDYFQFGLSEKPDDREQVLNQIWELYKNGSIENVLLGPRSEFTHQENELILTCKKPVEFFGKKMSSIHLHFPGEQTIHHFFMKHRAYWFFLYPDYLKSEVSIANAFGAGGKKAVFKALKDILVNFVPIGVIPLKLRDARQREKFAGKFSNDEMQQERLLDVIVVENELDEVLRNKGRKKVFPKNPPLKPSKPEPVKNESSSNPRADAKKMINSIFTRVIDNLYVAPQFVVTMINEAFLQEKPFDSAGVDERYSYLKEYVETHFKKPTSREEKALVDLFKESHDVHVSQEMKGYVKNFLGHLRYAVLIPKESVLNSPADANRYLTESALALSWKKIKKRDKYLLELFFTVLRETEGFEDIVRVMEDFFERSNQEFSLWAPFFFPEGFDHYDVKTFLSLTTSIPDPENDKAYPINEVIDALDKKHYFDGRAGLRELLTENKEQGLIKYGISFVLSVMRDKVFAQYATIKKGFFDAFREEMKSQKGFILTFNREEDRMRTLSETVKGDRFLADVTHDKETLAATWVIKVSGIPLDKLHRISMEQPTIPIDRLSKEFPEMVDVINQMPIDVKEIHMPQILGVKRITEKVAIDFAIKEKVVVELGPFRYRIIRGGLEAISRTGALLYTIKDTALRLHIEHLASELIKEALSKTQTKGKITISFEPEPVEFRKDEIVDRKVITFNRETGEVSFDESVADQVNLPQEVLEASVVVARAMVKALLVDDYAPPIKTEPFKEVLTEGIFWDKWGLTEDQLKEMIVKKIPSEVFLPRETVAAAITDKNLQDAARLLRTKGDFKVVVDAQSLKPDQLPEFFIKPPDLAMLTAFRKEALEYQEDVSKRMAKMDELTHYLIDNQVEKIQQSIVVNEQEEGEAVFIDFPLMQRVLPEKYFSMVKTAVSSNLGAARKNKVAYNSLRQIHLTVGSPEKGRNPFQLGIDDVLKWAQEDAKNIGPFVIQLMGPHLTPNGVIIMEFRVVTPEIMQMREALEKRVHQYSLSNGNFSKLINIYHSTIGVIRDPKIKREDLRAINDALTEIRKQIQEGPPMEMLVKRAAVTIIDLKTRRFKENKVFDLDEGQDWLISLNGGKRVLDDYSRRFLDEHHAHTQRKISVLWHTLVNKNYLSIGLTPVPLMPGQDMLDWRKSVLLEFSRNHQDFINNLDPKILSQLFTQKLLMSQHRQMALRDFLKGLNDKQDVLTEEERNFLNELNLDEWLVHQGVSVENVKDKSVNRGTHQGSFVYEVTLGLKGKKFTFIMVGYGHTEDLSKVGDYVREPLDPYVQGFTFGKSQDASMLGVEIGVEDKAMAVTKKDEFTDGPQNVEIVKIPNKYLTLEQEKFLPEVDYVDNPEYERWDRLVHIGKADALPEGISMLIEKKYPESVKARQDRLQWQLFYSGRVAQAVVNKHKEVFNQEMPSNSKIAIGYEISSKASRQKALVMKYVFEANGIEADVVEVPARTALSEDVIDSADTLALEMAEAAMKRAVNKEKPLVKKAAAKKATKRKTPASKKKVQIKYVPDYSGMFMAQLTGKENKEFKPYHISFLVKDDVSLSIQSFKDGKETAETTVNKRMVKAMEGTKNFKFSKNDESSELLALMLGYGQVEETAAKQDDNVKKVGNPVEEGRPSDDGIEAIIIPEEFRPFILKRPKHNDPAYVNRKNKIDEHFIGRQVQMIISQIKNILGRDLLENDKILVACESERLKELAKLSYAVLAANGAQAYLNKNIITVLDFVKNSTFSLFKSNSRFDLAFYIKFSSQGLPIVTLVMQGEYFLPSRFEKFFKDVDEETFFTYSKASLNKVGQISFVDAVDLINTEDGDDAMFANEDGYVWEWRPTSEQIQEMEESAFFKPPTLESSTGNPRNRIDDQPASSNLIYDDTHIEGRSQYPHPFDSIEDELEGTILSLPHNLLPDEVVMTIARAVVSALIDPEGRITTKKATDLRCLINFRINEHRRYAEIIANVLAAYGVQVDYGRLELEGFGELGDHLRLLTTSDGEYDIVFDVSSSEVQLGLCDMKLFMDGEPLSLESIDVMKDKYEQHLKSPLNLWGAVGRFKSTLLKERVYSQGSIVRRDFHLVADKDLEGGKFEDEIILLSPGLHESRYKGENIRVPTAEIDKSHLAGVIAMIEEKEVTIDRVRRMAQGLADDLTIGMQLESISIAYEREKVKVLVAAKDEALQEYAKEMVEVLLGGNGIETFLAKPGVKEWQLEKLVDKRRGLQSYDYVFYLDKFSYYHLRDIHTVRLKGFVGDGVFYPETLGFLRKQIKRAWRYLKKPIGLLGIEEIDVDTAMFSDVGGIDLNEIDVKRKGLGADMRFDPAMLGEILSPDFTGFKPSIINITPIQNIYPILGIK